MKSGVCLAVVVIVPVLALALTPPCSAEPGRSAEPDSGKAYLLFNPPRVLTPEDTSAAGAGEPVGFQPARDDRRPELPPERPGQRGGCAKCGGSGRPRIGGGGGPEPGYLFANLDKINDKVRAMGIPELTEGLLIMGGKGYARIGSFVIGGAGYGGSTESSGIPDCCARYAQMEIGYGGLILGFCRPAARYDVTAGVLLGGGSIKIERKRNSRDVLGWDDSWDIFREDNPDSVATEDLSITSSIRADFIAIEPFIDFKYWVFPFVAIDFSGSYLRANVGRGTWKLDGVKIPDSPESDLGGMGIKLGLHFGV